jgi:hypothetical protein
MASASDFLNSSAPVAGSFWESGSAEEIQGASDLPFKGIKGIGPFSLRDSFYWDIGLKVHAPAVATVPQPIPNNPFGEWFPAVSYTIEMVSLNTTNFETIPGWSIPYPSGITFAPRINMEVIEEDQLRVDRYLTEYINAIWTAEKKVLPYKNCVSELTIYITDSCRERRLRKTFLAIPNLSLSYQGSSQSQSVVRGIEFFFVGEIGNLTGLGFWASTQ